MVKVFRNLIILGGVLGFPFQASNALDTGSLSAYLTSHSFNQPSFLKAGGPVHALLKNLEMEEVWQNDTSTLIVASDPQGRMVLLAWMAPEEREHRMEDLARKILDDELSKVESKRDYVQWKQKRAKIMGAFHKVREGGAKLEARRLDQPSISKHGEDSVMVGSVPVMLQFHARSGDWLAQAAGAGDRGR